MAAGAAAGSPAEAAKERAAAGGGRFDVELAGVEVFDRERAVIGPDHVRELGEDAVEVEGVRLGEAHGEQVQAQVGVGRIRDRVVKGAYGEHRFAAHATGVGLRLRQRPELVVGAVRAFGRDAERQLRIPDVECVPGCIDAGQSPAPCGAFVRHACLLGG